jgi:hypothetical protein
MALELTWTEADRDALKAAILKLASGEAVTTVSYTGPPARSVTYQAMNLTEMRALLAEVQANLNTQAGGKPYRFAATRKGFD